MSQAIATSSWPVATLQAGGFRVISGVHERASVLARHTHDAPTICCVQRGRFTEYYPGKAVDCDARTLKVTPAGEPHWNHFGGATTYGIRIDVDVSRFEGAGAITRMLGERVFVPAGSFAELTDQLVLELRRSDAVSGLATEGLLLELVARLARAVENTTPPRPAWLGRADELVRASFREPLTIGTVAAAVGVRPHALASGYRLAFGCSIAERIRRLRLEYAAQQLAHSDAGIAEIAATAGFYDQSHLSHSFRRHFGVTPGVFRRHAAAGATPRRPHHA